MRRCIYRNELDHIEQLLNEIHKDLFWSIKGNLFEVKNGYSIRGKSKLLYVKDDFKDIDHVKDFLKKNNNISLSIINEIIDIIDINEDLFIPPELEQKFIERKVVIFVGAGISTNIGYPSWWQFGKKSIDTLLEKDDISYSVHNDILSNNTDPKQLLSIFESVYPKGRPEHNELYKNAFNFNNYKSEDNDKVSTGRKLVSLLTNPVFGNKFITTNIDTEIENVYKQKNYTEDSSVLDDSQTQEVGKTPLLSICDKTVIANYEFSNLNSIVHIHGSYEYPESTVFTIKDYNSTYFNKESEVVKFLNYVFEKYTVLFLGYGLAEFSILEQVIKSRKNNQHFSLEPIFFNEIETLNLKTKVFENLGVNIVPYFRDFDNYGRLLKVIEFWENKLVKKDFFEDRLTVSDIINSGYIEENENKLITIIKVDKDQLDLFLRKSNDKRWIYRLKQENIFDTDSYPIPDKSNGDNNCWVQAIYLQNILEENLKERNKDIEDIVLKIVTEIVKKSYNNNWLDSCINKILTLIPNDKVECNLLKEHLHNLEIKSNNRPIDNHTLITELLSSILSSADKEKIELFIGEIFQLKVYKNSTLRSDFKTKFDSSSLEYTLTKEYLSNFEIEVIKIFYNQLLKIVIPQMCELKDGTEISFEIGEDKYNFKIEFIGTFSFTVNVSGKKAFDFKIENYNLKTQEQVFQEVRKNFSVLNLAKLKLHNFIGDSEKDITAPFRRLYFDTYYINGYKFFKNEHQYSPNDFTVILKIIVRLIEIIYEKDEINQSTLIKELLDNKYYFPFFKRASLSLICNNYVKHRKLFWDNIKSNNFLSDYKYEDDSFYLLDTNKERLSDEEISILSKIIEAGPVTEDKNNDEQFKMRWQFKWYYILRHQTIYKPKYEDLRLKVNDGKDFVWQPSGIVAITGLKSPINIKDLEQKTVNDTVNYLLAYKRDESNFKGPDEGGLSNVLKSVIENNPIKYIKEIDLFMKVHNTYVYALTDALEKHVSAKYNSHLFLVLEFYYKFFSSTNFTYEKQDGEDYYRIKPGKYVVREFLRLLKKLVIDNDIELNKPDLDKIKKLIILIHSFLKPEYYKDNPNNGYIMFSINNSQGMFYELLLQISLREGRDYAYQNEKWRYEKYFKNAITDNNDSALTVFGQYFNNFLWLYKDWALIKFQSLKIGSESWQAFFGGYLPVNPIVSTDGYQLIKQSYEYLIKHNINYSISGGYGIGNHLFVLYYYGIIELEEGSLIDLYYSASDSKKTELIRAILYYEKFLNDLQHDKKIEFENRLTKLISFITTKLINSDNNNETLYYLFNLISLFEKLNHEVIRSLLSITSKVPIEGRSYRFIPILKDYIEKDQSIEYADMLLQIYENRLEELINASIYSYTIDIWDFIMRKVNIQEHKKIILKISEAFIRRGNDMLQGYFTKLAKNIK